MARLSLAGDGIALVAPTASESGFGAADLDELEAIIARIASEPGIRAAIFMTPEDDFCLGSDPAWYRAMAAAGTGAASRDDAVRAVMSETGRLSKMLRTLETCGKPAVAAIAGRCFGAGLDLALACQHRIAADVPAVRFGFPQIAVGMMPNGGGTQRLPRIVGTKAALEMLLKGTTVAAPQARELGLIHVVVSAASLLDRARERITAANVSQPGDGKGFDPPGGTPYGREGMQSWPVFNALYRKETHDHYEARRAILSSTYEGLCVRSMDAALAIELRYVTRTLLSPQSHVMLRSLHESVAELEAGARRPKGVPPSEIRRVGIIGAGFMGAGIAFSAAAAGLDVLLLDRDVESAEKGKAGCAETLKKAVARGTLPAGDEAGLLERIAVGADFAALSGVDLAIEAVFENRDVKADVLSRAGAMLRSDAVLASNTSTLPITSLAGHGGRPDRFIGIHFFSPVDRMRLVEIIPGRQTSDEALAVAFDFVRRLRKTPIVVNDSRGFFTSRVVMTHKKEGIRMLEEGVPPALIENAGRAAGMPVGPLALADEVALDLSWKILSATRNDLGESYESGPIDRILEEMVERRGRFGRKNRKGFYDYPPDGRKRLWPGLSDICPPRDAAGVSFEELKERLLLIQALETARCFAEGVLADVREADVGAILGFGFAPFTGGPLSYIDAMGTGVFLGKCRAYMRRFGNHYRPPKLLVDMAKKGETFYGRFSPPRVVG